MPGIFCLIKIVQKLFGDGRHVLGVVGSIWRTLVNCFGKRSDQGIKQRGYLLGILHIGDADSGLRSKSGDQPFQI